MKIALLTSPVKMMSECDTLEYLLEEGLDYLHIRKEEEDEPYVRKIVNTLPKRTRHQLVLHGYRELAVTYEGVNYHHKSKSNYFDNFNTGFQTKAFHSIEEIKACKDPYKYGFLSPIFDSISKKDYKAAFDAQELKEFLHSEEKKFPIYALGGVNVENVKQAKALGFDGIAVLGAIWGELFSHKKISVFKELKKEMA